MPGTSVIAPADGKVVVIEEAFDEEYFNEKRLQISIFMSPANVHQNRCPESGEVVYSKYHKGKYLVAWHPKSSTENERHSVVYRQDNKELLVKQMKGLYKVKSPGLVPLFERARSLSRRLQYFSIEHVRRERNREADRMVNQVLDQKERNPR